jgi:hypothetical protein
MHVHPLHHSASRGLWPVGHSSPSQHRRLAPIDLVLVTIFLAGLYLGVSLPITSKIPLTCAPSGIAGVILLWRRRDQIEPGHLVGLLAVLFVFVASILAANDFTFLAKRFTGLVQISYSLLIAYALFLTLVRAERRQIAAILLGFCVFILLGCLLETYGNLRPFSDKVRALIFDKAYIYDADVRDEILYGRIRPKFFTAEPSAVTFAFTHYASNWLVVSPWRWKALAYLALLGGALLVLPGPTLILMLLLLVPYLFFVAGVRARAGMDVTRIVGAAALSVLFVGAAIVIGQALFAERLSQLTSGRDASFFYRFTGPMLVAFDIFRTQPWAGAGLTGEPFIVDQVINVFMNSSSFQAAWKFSRVGDVLTNYFWLHWIYLGMVFGGLAIVAITFWLRCLGTASLAFAWSVWVILGQASGAYVGPKTWSVLLIAAAVSTLALRSPARAFVVRAGPAPRGMAPALTFPQSAELHA